MTAMSPLLTPEQLRDGLGITEDEYGELVAVGLPVIRFGSGDVRHPTGAVNEFFLRLAGSDGQAFPELVGSPYIAGRLGCSTVWVTELVRRGDIPPSCVVPGTGNGKPWKFRRILIDKWIRRR